MDSGFISRPNDENDAGSDSDAFIIHDISNDPDGSAYLLRLLDGNPRSYQIWAEQNYERLVSLDAITHIYEHRPLTQNVIAALNPDCVLQELLAEVEGTGYGDMPATATA